MYKGQSLGRRIGAYKKVSKTKLIPKLPVVAELQLKSFENYIKTNFFVLFDKSFIPLSIDKSFRQATLKVCESIEQIELAYYRKDKVLFFLKDYSKIEDTQYYSGDTQSISSTISSMFTYWFNKYLFINYENKHNIAEFIRDLTPAFFNCTSYNLPLHEVINNFIFLQREVLVNYKNLHFPNGTVFYKTEIEKQVSTLPQHLIEKLENEFIVGDNWDTITRKKWACDVTPPIFSKNKQYLEQFIFN